MRLMVAFVAGSNRTFPDWHFQPHNNINHAAVRSCPDQCDAPEEMGATTLVTCQEARSPNLCNVLQAP